MASVFFNGSFFTFRPFLFVFPPFKHVLHPKVRKLRSHINSYEFDQRFIDNSYHKPNCSHLK